MTDTEMLEWVLGKLEQGLSARERNEWFLNGENIAFGYLWDTPNERLAELTQSGALVKKHTGYYLDTGLDEEFFNISEGSTIREAIAEAMRKEKAG